MTPDLDAAMHGCDGLVVPGVGAFAACMAGIRRIGGEKVIASRVEAGRPVLGICVGMQVLFDAGVEHGQRTEGCGIFPGTVERLDAPVLPHMGWNTVAPPQGARCCSICHPGRDPLLLRALFRAARTLRDAAPLLDAGAKLTVTEHGEPFAAAVEQGVLAATQFHPEKSGDACQQARPSSSNWLATLEAYQARPALPQPRVSSAPP